MLCVVYVVFKLGVGKPIVACVVYVVFKLEEGKYTVERTVQILDTC